MTTHVEYPHLATDADGTVRIAGTRYKVLHLAGEHYQHGWSAEELLRQHPDLRPEQVYAAMTYVYDHFDELVSRLRESAEAVEKSRPTAPFTRAELSRRRSNEIVAPGTRDELLSRLKTRR